MGILRSWGLNLFRTRGKSLFLFANKGLRNRFFEFLLNRKGVSADIPVDVLVDY